MAATYTPIATTTLGSAASNVTFNSIPSTYTDLVLVISANISTAQNAWLQFNGDTGANYSDTFLYGNGTSAASGRNSSITVGYIDAYGYFPSAANTFGTNITHIMNYSNTTTYKTFISRGNNAGAGVEANVTLWRSTAAINSILIDLVGATTYSAGSTFTLYGILAA